MALNHTKRGLAIATSAVAVLALSLTGCSTDPGSEEVPPTSSGSSPTSDGEKISLLFWNGLTGTDKESVDEVVSRFNASQDRIEVTSEALPWDVLHQKLLSSIGTGSGPDVVSIDTGDLAKFVEAGALQSVDDFYAGDYMDSDVLVQAAVKANDLGGASYGIPLNFFTAMMYWNKDIFAAAGYDHAPASWDEFVEMAPKLTVDEDGDGTPEQYPIALGDHDTVPMWEPLLWNTGGGIVADDGKTVLLDDPKTLEAVSFWVDQVKNNKVSPIGMNGPDSDALFQSGKAAIEICGPWVAPSIADAGINYGVARTMEGPDGQWSLAGSVSFTVPTGVDEAAKSAIYEFVAFWNSKDVQAMYSEQTGFPSTRTDITAEDTGDNPLPGIFGDPEVTGESKVFLPGVHNGAALRTEVFVPALQKVLNGAGTVEEIFAQAQKDAEALIND